MLKTLIFALASITFLNSLIAQNASSFSNKVFLDTIKPANGKSPDFMNRISVGVDVGYDQNYLLTNISNLSFTTIKPLNGYSIGIPFLYKLNSWMSLSTNPSITQKNYKIERTGFYQGIHENFTNSYIQLPIYGHFIFGDKKMKGFLNLGGYGAYWAWAKIAGTESNILNPSSAVYSNSNPLSLLAENEPFNYSQRYQFNKIRDNRLEFGWLLGIGLSYEFTKRYVIFMEGRFTQSITDQQKKYIINQVPRYNQTYNLSIGCLINLGSFKKQHNLN